MKTTLAIGLVALSLASVANGKGEPPKTLRALYGMKTPTEIKAARTALVLIDFQDEFIHGRLPLPNGERAVTQAVALAKWARASGVLVVNVWNVAKSKESLVFRRGSTSVQPVAALTTEPNDWVLEKSMGGAFSRTELDARLRARGIDTLVVAGLMTHLAVTVTATDAMVLGYRVIVASDASATRSLPGAGGYESVDAKTVQRAALAILADRVADVMPTRAILALSIR